MNLEEAKELLNGCTREELQDHAFGDAEVTWVKDGKEIAGGYFGGGKSDIWFLHEASGGASFAGVEARQLRKCGTMGRVERNDETGPDEFVEDKIMPGLTLEGVRKELTGGFDPIEARFDEIESGLRALKDTLDKELGE